MDPRTEKLASNLVNISCEVKKGEHVLINANGCEAIDLVNAIIKEVYACKAYPHVNLKEQSVTRQLYMNADEEQLKVMNDYELYRMKQMDVYIGIGAGSNTYETGDVPAEKYNLVDTFLRSSFDERVNNTRWVVLRYPSPSMAQAARMSTEAFEDYFYSVCNLDYRKMGEAMKSLKALMERTDKVRITGKGTDLSFSIKGIPAVPCAGEANIPDGEIFTAPVRDSVNGVISYNTPSQNGGFTFENIVLKFKDGKIIEATANDTERINKIFDTDEGARYVGEFSFGVNPYITKPMLDTLFDEKIAGSLHFTPGACYEGEAENGNHSAIHWDLVFIQTPEYGGGDIYFDDVLIRRDGRFVTDELKCLNPENLI